MTRSLGPSFSGRANKQGAKALLAATLAFLDRNNMQPNEVLESIRRQGGRKTSLGTVRDYRRLARAYENMGMIMSAWFSHPRFLDRESRPLRLTPNQGTLSIARLVRSSRVNISVALAIELMRRSPSVRIDSRGRFVALKRVFVLPDFEVPRAALVIERYLDTLRKNSSAQKRGTTLLLERNCHVPEIDLTRISPVLRDIRERGSAFMDSVDGDIEALRTRKSQRKGVGELGVLVFAWTRPSKARRP
jgi:hypothetical protein